MPGLRPASTAGDISRWATSIWRAFHAWSRSAESLKYFTVTDARAGLPCPLYEALGLSSALVPALYAPSVYGPEPSALPSSRRDFAGYFSLSTIEAAPVAILKGKVASRAERLKVTVRPSALTDSRVLKSGAGPWSELIALMRSKEYLTSSAVIARPPANFTSGRSSHW